MVQTSMGGPSDLELEEGRVYSKGRERPRLGPGDKLSLVRPESLMLRKNPVLKAPSVLWSTVTSDPSV